MRGGRGLRVEDAEENDSERKTSSRLTLDTRPLVRPFRADTPCTSRVRVVHHNVRRWQLEPGGPGTLHKGPQCALEPAISSGTSVQVANMHSRTCD